MPQRNADKGSKRESDRRGGGQSGRGETRCEPRGLRAPVRTQSCSECARKQDQTRGAYEKPLTLRRCTTCVHLTAEHRGPRAKLAGPREKQTSLCHCWRHRWERARGSRAAAERKDGSYLGGGRWQNLEAEGQQEHRDA